MGKLSKRQRTANLKLREELASLKTHQESVNAFNGRALAKMTERAEAAEWRLKHWHDKVAEFCASSTLLPLEKKLKFINQHMRVLVRDMDIRAIEHEIGWEFKSRPIEDLMMILQCESELCQDLTRRMHFRVTNVPGQRGDFAMAYAVSRTAVESCRSEAHKAQFVSLIAESVARGIWGEIFGDKKL